MTKRRRVAIRSHKVSKGRVVASWIILFLAELIFPFNLFPQPQSPFERAKDGPNHQLLAQMFLANNDLVKAALEADLAKDDLLMEKIASLSAQPDIIKDEITKWEIIAAKNPHYRDAYLKLAALNWKIFKGQQVKENLLKAKEIDPNFTSPLLSALE